MTAGEQLLEGIWRFVARHPEWTEDDVVPGEDGWEPDVAWWAVAADPGLVLIDPLVDDWRGLDEFVEAQRGCAGIVRTLHFHQRSITEAAARYEAEVWAQPPPPALRTGPYDRAARDGAQIVGGLRCFNVERGDEIALWLPGQRVLLFGDAMLSSESGALVMCPESWTQPPGGRERLREILRALADSLPVEHVLVSHGPVVPGDGAEALAAALR
jgi:glyoxylase-like metal-dependent hydrolase (beta-lactamase superfamily II)